MTDEERKKLNKENIHKVFRKRVNELCMKKGYTPYALAYRASVPLSTLLHMLDESGTNPSLYNIIKICDGLDITLANFFDTEEFEVAVIESRDEK